MTRERELAGAGAEVMDWDMGQATFQMDGRPLPGAARAVIVCKTGARRHPWPVSSLFVLLDTTGSQCLIADQQLDCGHVTLFL